MADPGGDTAESQCDQETTHGQASVQQTWAGKAAMIDGGTAHNSLYGRLSANFRLAAAQMGSEDVKIHLSTVT